ncbi:CHASE3 domain-containing protein [Plantactinospora sp. B24E8]|uniref:CHASE3 domain-containing protein n=1 Tax=Plantactinospora sp. B24E8 TaxID=3153567 RepID=UPI00325D5721
MRYGLTRRLLTASGLLAVVLGATFGVLLSSVVDVRAAERQARRAEEVLVAANRLERLLVDLETGQRGYALTGRQESLAPWHAARSGYPAQAAELERLVADDPGQLAWARALGSGIDAYVNEHSVPLVEAPPRDPATVREAEVDGDWWIGRLRGDFDQLVRAEQHQVVARQHDSDNALNRAIGATVAGLVASLLLVAGYAGHLNRVVARPVRRVAEMAGRLAGGDLGVRLPERGVGEVGVLERAFNGMAGALETSRDELAASRARIVAAADQARRRIERNLHDGTQQRLVSLVLELRAVEAELPDEPPEPRSRLAQIADGLTGAVDELREISRGIHPAILSEGGITPAVKALARRSAVPVELDLAVPGRLPELVEVTAYYVVSEALANVAKHARASVVEVGAELRDGGLRLSVRDDGVGGVDPGRGSGLVGIADRVAAAGGTVSVSSPPGQGTTLLVDLPAQTRAG